MKEYRLVWCRYPYAHNERHVLFVKADTPQDAVHVAIDHIERRFGIPRHDFGISTPGGADMRLGKVEEVEPVPTGEVLNVSTARRP